MRLGKSIRLSRLLDIYGELLTERQRTVLSEYVNEDLSLYEIGEILGVTRQGVRDTVLKAEANLEEYDAKLGLLEKSDALESALKAINRVADEIPKEQREKILFETSRIAEQFSLDKSTED